MLQIDVDFLIKEAEDKKIEECAKFVEEQGKLLKTLLDSDKYESFISELAKGIRKKKSQ